MMTASLKTLAATLAAAVLLTACGQETQEHHIKVGAIAGLETQVVEVAKQVAKEKFNLDVEIVSFSDYVTPNIALNDGSIDVNAFQHLPYLEAQIQDRGYKLVPVGNTFVYPIAGYSKKITQLAQLADGAKVALPNDPTNLGRSLLLLEKQGLLTLKDGVGLTGSVLDVVANPKQLKLIELEAAQLPRSLDDVDLAIINTTYASQLGLLPSRDGLFVEDKESPYVNLIVARENNQQDEKVKQFVQAYQSEEVHQAALKLFNGGVVKGW